MITIIPFSGPLLISKQDHSLSKGDLKSTPTPLSTLPLVNRVRVANAQLEPTRVLQAEMMGELTLGGGSLGVEAGTAFILNMVAKTVITRAPGSTLSDAVKSSPEFIAVHQTIRNIINSILRRSTATGILDYHELAEPKKKVPPPGLNFSGFQQLHVIIGSFQGVNINLTDFTADQKKRIYTAKLTYEWFDHFGVDDSDLTFDFRGHGSSGQVALWVLQRERHPGNMPYVLKVVIDESASGSF